MSEQVRLCPHCGAAVSGNTERCPRCDEVLSEREAKVIEPALLNPPIPSSSGASGIEEDEETEVLLSRPAQMTSISAELSVEQLSEQLEPPPEVQSVEPEPPPLDPSPAEVQPDEDIAEPISDAIAAEPDPFTDASDRFEPMTEDVASTFKSVDDLVPALPEATPLPNELEDTGKHQATPTDDPILAMTNATPQNAFQDTPPRGSSAIIPIEFEEAHTEPVTYGQLLRPAPVPMPEPLPALDTQPKLLQPLPPAPFTPPPLMSQPAAVNVLSDQSYQQRIVAYAQGGYRLLQRLPNETVMSYGKSLSFLWWIIATASGFGIMWYWFVLLTSGFRADRVYILLEPDGYVYEEGAGAAHLRRRRARNSRRWGVFGAFMLLVSVFSLILAVLAGSVMLDRYQNELNAAYPELGLFSNTIPPNNLDATEVQNVRVAVLALLILSAMSVSGAVAGIMIAFIGYLQAAAYRVQVAPLPYMR